MVRILNFGSLNIDYTYFVSEFVRPGETISSVKLETFCGGKGLNQSVALARAGAEVFHAGCIGEDGELLVETLISAGINTDFVRTVDGKSGHAMIQVNKDGQNSIILFGGANRGISKEHIRETLAVFGKNDWLLLQNEINHLDVIMKEAHAAGMKIALNPSPMNEDIFKLPLRLVSCFLLNSIEGRELTGEKDPQRICSRLAKLYPKSFAVLTLGADGAMFSDGNNRFFEKIIPVEVADTTAAGDTFTGYFLAGVMKGVTYDKALKIATAASAIAVGKKGAVPSIPQKETVIKLLQKEYPEKILF